MQVLGLEPRAPAFQTSTLLTELLMFVFMTIGCPFHCRGGDGVGVGRCGGSLWTCLDVLCTSCIWKSMEDFSCWLLLRAHTEYSRGFLHATWEIFCAALAFEGLNV